MSNLNQFVSKNPLFNETDYLEGELERLTENMSATELKNRFRDIYAQALKQTRESLSKPKQKKKKKPKILTWNPKLVEYHAKKRQEKIKQQNILFRQIKILFNNQKRITLKLKNI